MNKNINKIIRESIRNVINEMDLVPTDKQGNANLVQNQAVNAWRMIYRLMDNVKTSMDATKQGKKKISIQDVDSIVDYINDSLQNIMKNTIGGNK